MKCVIDRSSLINLQRNYLFDKHKSKKQYDKFKSFFKNKFNNGDIIIIDKVDNENVDRFIKEFEVNRAKIMPTDGNLDLLNSVSDDRRNFNPKYKGTDEAKEVEKNKEKREKADLSLVAFCKKIKESGEDVTLVSDESEAEHRSKKLYKKIPNMCKNYKIPCIKIADLIFEKFSDEISFEVVVKQEDRGSP